MLTLQLAMLRAELASPARAIRLKEAAGLLEEKSAIPMVRGSDGADPGRADRRVVQDATVPILRRCAADCVIWIKFIEKQKRKPIYTDFEGLMGEETPSSCRALAKAPTT